MDSVPHDDYARRAVIVSRLHQSGRACEDQEAPLGIAIADRFGGAFAPETVTPLPAAGFAAVCPSSRLPFMARFYRSPRRSDMSEVEGQADITRASSIRRR
jgi:hypothetical protein